MSRPGFTNGSGRRRRAAVVLLVLLALAVVLLVGIVASVRGVANRDTLPFSARAPLTIARSDSLSIDGDIINGLAAQHALVSQRGIGSVPVYGLYGVTERLRMATSIHLRWLDIASVNVPLLTKVLTLHHKVFDLGGIILYGGNLAAIRTLASYRALVSDWRQRFTFDVYVRVIDSRTPAGTTYRVTIQPFIVADCDLAYDHFRYCRGPFLANAMESPDSATDLRERLRQITRDFASIGLNSTLSPEVDVAERDSVAEMVDLARVATAAALEAGLVPVLKHFAYDPALGDTHRASFYNPLSDAQFRQALEPYFAVEQMNVPYFIMLSHHRLPMDSLTPLPQSAIISAFIRKTFPNAMTMSDAINMSGLTRGTSLRKVVTSLHTDTFLFQSGNVQFLLPFVLDGLDDVHTAESEESVRKLLFYKERIGLLKISPVANR